jgi:hydrogenase/urease accessory protein HupE
VGNQGYQSFMFGVTLILFGSVVVWTARTPRPVGYLMVLSCLTYLVEGWVLGSEGFSAANTVTTLLGYVLVVAWTIWLLIFAWRMSEPAAAPVAAR